MLTPDYLEHCANDIVHMYDRLHESVMDDIVRRVLRMGEISTTSAYQIERLEHAGVLHDDILRTISKRTAKSERAMKALFEKAAMESFEFDNEVYRAAGLKPIDIKQSPAMLQILQAGLIKTNGVMHNLALTTAATGQSAYIEAVDLAYMQVSSGAMSHNQAIRYAVNSLARKGVMTVQYRGGRPHVDQIDVAVRRAVLAGLSQTTGQMQMMAMDELECDLIETSAHMGARPSHAEWQGQVFSRSGLNRDYDQFEDATGYGTGEGLCGWGCRHSFYPFFEGVSTPNYTPNQILGYANQALEYDGKTISMYEATQKQRGFERSIRKLKRELIASDIGYKNAKNKEQKQLFEMDFIKKSAQLKKKEAELKGLLDQTGLHRYREREQMSGFSRSLAQKAVHASKK